MSYPPPGPPVPGYSAPVPDQESIRTSAIVLIVVGFLCGGMLPSIFGIIALVQADTDPYSARTMNKVGWIITWVLLGITVLALLASLAWAGFVVLLIGSVATAT
ncbi:hypothetical protein ACFQS2_12035 [Brachybacterium sp. GCM10030267]|uniref:hypothetical protein n=1 Tax=Brachybacterium sp. GCM10030267 TaxID=3273381 RepID=UPI00360ABE65